MGYQKFSIHKFLNKFFFKERSKIFLYKITIVRGQPVKGFHSNFIMREFK